MSPIVSRKRLGQGLTLTSTNSFPQSSATLTRTAKLTAKRKKLLQTVLAERDEGAREVIARVHKPAKTEPDPPRGLFPATVNGKECVVEYEPDTDLRDTEQVPLLEEGGIEAFGTRSCPTRRTPGTTRSASRSATRSVLLATSTSRSHCARWTRSEATSWPWKETEGLLARSSGQGDS